jgi:hypothetical protein
VGRPADARPELRRGSALRAIARRTVRAGERVGCDVADAALVGVRWSDRVRAVGSEPHAVPHLPGLVLVRPDGYVAWAADARSGDGVVEAVTRWCGTATFADQFQRSN